jgi:hypothetical protein
VSVEPSVVFTSRRTILRVSFLGYAESSELSCIWTHPKDVQIVREIGKTHLVDFTEAKLLNESLIACSTPPHVTSGRMTLRISVNGQVESVDHLLVDFIHEPTVLDIAPRRLLSASTANITVKGLDFPTYPRRFDAQCVFQRGQHQSTSIMVIESSSLARCNLPPEITAMKEIQNVSFSIKPTVTEIKVLEVSGVLNSNQIHMIHFTPWDFGDRIYELKVAGRIPVDDRAV